MQKGCNPWRLGHCPQAHVPLSWQQEPFISAQAIATYPLQLGKQQRLCVPAWCPLPMEVDRASFCIARTRRVLTCLVVA